MWAYADAIVERNWSLIINCCATILSHLLWFYCITVETVNGCCDKFDRCHPNLASTEKQHRSILQNISKWAYLTFIILTSKCIVFVQRMFILLLPRRKDNVNRLIDWLIDCFRNGMCVCVRKYLKMFWTDIIRKNACVLACYGQMDYLLERLQTFQRILNYFPGFFTSKR